jgi:HlyD family secretion protein
MVHTNAILEINYWFWITSYQHMKYFAILLVITLIFSSCRKGRERTKPILGMITETVYASGVVKSKNQYQVHSAVGGLIREIIVKEGDTVRKGDPLIVLMNETSKLNTRNAELAAAYADLKANAYKLDEAQVAIGLALSKLRNDSLLFVRQQNLWSQGVGTKVEFEQRELAYKNSATNYEVSLSRYRDLKRQLELASSQAKTNLLISTALTNDFVIKAESSGKIYKILKERGEFVNTVNPVAIIGDAHSFFIELKVDEYDIASIQLGQKVLCTLGSFKGSVFDATITEIEPLMDEQSKSFTTKADFVTEPPVLYPGLSVEANIMIQVKKNAITIPRSYLLNDSLVLTENGEMRKVITGLKDYQKVEILSGLTQEDVIYKPDQ